MPLLSVATGGFLCFIPITDYEIMLTRAMIQPASQQAWVQLPGKPIPPGAVFFCTAIITCNQAPPYFLCMRKDVPSQVS